jgi:alpha-1,3-glucosyltransferase
MFALHLAEAIRAPPTRYPDLYPVLNVLICAPIFGLAWCWSIIRGVEGLWAVGALGGTSEKKDRSTEKQGKERVTTGSTVTPVD